MQSWCRRPALKGNRASHNAPVQDSPVSAHCVIGNRSMKEASVIPNHQIAAAPTMHVNKFRSRCMLKKFIEQRHSFRLCHTKDVRGVVSEIECLLPGLRMGAHERMVDRRVLTR